MATAIVAEESNGQRVAERKGDTKLYVWVKQVNLGKGIVCLYNNSEININSAQKKGID
jgi:hypothetical protein